jgi:DNA-binding response OmpR family regulator
MNSPLTGRLILIVEDEPPIALQMTQAFEDAGAWVVRAHTLIEALTGVEARKLSAAVLDHALSDGDTLTVCERMNERNIPFVIYSDYERPRGAARQGVYVKKPVGMPELIAIVERAVAGRQTSGKHPAAVVKYTPVASTPRRTLHLS